MMRPSDRRALREVRKTPDVAALCEALGACFPGFQAEMARAVALAEVVEGRYSAGETTPDQDGAIALWAAAAKPAVERFTADLARLNRRLALDL